MQEWGIWRPMPSPENCRNIIGPKGPGLYQIRDKKTGEYILFGIGVECKKRMRSLYPKPYGVGTRNNEYKRIYILENWESLEYRTISTETRELAAFLEVKVKSLSIHKFNT